MANEVTKTIWGGLISSASAVDGTNAMRQHANTQLTAGSPVIANSTDISRAASVGTTLSTSIPNNDAKAALDADISNGNLVATLNAFLTLYSKIRIFNFHKNRSSWGNGNGAAVVPNYTRTAYKTNPGVSTGSDGAPVGAYDDIEAGDDIDKLLYKDIIGSLKTVITTNSNKGDVTINYCHSSCHSVCHHARGRR